MIFSRRIYFTILAHILLILATAGVGMWIITAYGGYIIGGILILCALFQIGALAKQLNKFNQKIKFFFDAVEDKNNMLYFPEQHADKEQEQLNRSLNRINNLLARTKSENQKQEHFYRSLLEEVPSGVLAWNTAERVIITNTAAHTLLECQQLTNRQQVEQLLQGKEHLSFSQKQMKLQEEEITLLSIQDIGDALSDKESESWGKLTHVLTHEIMNTIAPITSLSQTLSTYPDTNAKSIRALKIIQTQSERLMEFTESFRHLSYLPHPEKKIFSLTALLHNIELLLQSDLEANNIAFNLTYPTDCGTMDGDENQLSQVFLNLLKNAMQAVEGQTNARMSINIIPSTDYLLIDISNNGTAIPKEVQEKIFIPFFTTKTEGSGIGLSLCKQIIRRHGGHLYLLKSDPQQTTFRIDLPQQTAQFV
jgi:nitrogen fixation/metabolism regulation signal transduction histidine kinase